MADPKLPDWIDRRTALWCAEHCEAIAARLLATRTPEIAMRQGAELCGISIRMMLSSGMPAVPDLVRDDDGAPKEPS